jgi:NAD-dependent SIR2 family protein deacetylase
MTMHASPGDGRVADIAGDAAESRFDTAASVADATPLSTPTATLDRLRGLLATSRRCFVLTGAGCSTASGIPDYRDLDGAWKRPPPMQYRLFMDEPLARARYWARSMIGWRRFGTARPNAAHAALARFEAGGGLSLLLTQNVDGLHEQAGSREVVDLHGRLDRVRCMACETRSPRTDFQRRLEAANPDWVALDAAVAPDGDADLGDFDFAQFVVPSCTVCGGVLKPDVVFFGESVPRDRVDLAMDRLAQSDLMLVVGSSLMVYSGFRFARAAAERGTPIVSINIGVTRADPLLAFKVEMPCDAALARLWPA